MQIKVDTDAILSVWCSTCIYTRYAQQAMQLTLTFKLLLYVLIFQFSEDFGPQQYFY